jgi:hypothetical protein
MGWSDGSELDGFEIGGAPGGLVETGGDAAEFLEFGGGEEEAVVFT